VAALAGFHGGGLATDDPHSPHRSAAALRAELYFGHADKDASPRTRAELLVAHGAARERGTADDDGRREIRDRPPIRIRRRCHTCLAARHRASAGRNRDRRTVLSCSKSVRAVVVWSVTSVNGR
jgi:hypothetical protein